MLDEKGAWCSLELFDQLVFFERTIFRFGNLGVFRFFDNFNKTVKRFNFFANVDAG